LRRRKLLTRRKTIVIKRQDLSKEKDLTEKYAAAAELRAKKVDEIRELLAIPPDPSDEEAVKLIARWRETGHVSVPAQLKIKTQRLLREWHSIHMVCIEIRDELEQLGKTASSHRITAASNRVR
jgi:hypothetical protein